MLQRYTPHFCIFTKKENSQLSWVKKYIKVLPCHFDSCRFELLKSG